ncbi:hypothetical protein E7681_11435 [Thalassobius vesicularis]|uniref:Uncharacterized protein n=1 Tax=Thalassobius vesicularis TaxID=1294297 RepID=A0A4S3MAE2_9RHOB|nr:hypothetical protein E7681_11435 [Thalassobius vesicularis]
MCPAARATWGDVCSLARRISWFEESGACMKPAFFIFDRGSVSPFRLFSIHKGCHGNSWKSTGIGGIFPGQGQYNTPKQRVIHRLSTDYLA